MNVYLSGPMTGRPGQNYDAFDTAAVALRTQGHVVWSPADYGRFLGWDGSLEPPPRVIQFLMRADVEAILRSDAIALMDGWEDSKGARLEHDLAVALGLQIIEDFA